MRMVIAGGGTGGHLFPGLAVAETWVGRGTGQVLFLGSAYGLEARVVPQRGFDFVPLPIKGARGRGWRGWVEFARQAPAAFRAAWTAVREFAPAVVVGLGGYGCVPVIVAAWARRVPVVLLEQNAHPGLANRLLAHCAVRVCTAFAEAERFFPVGKSVHTGNPVRFLGAVHPDARGQRESFAVLLFGGSQGARTINRAMVEAVRELKDTLPNLRVIHQTGSADEPWVREQYRTLEFPAEVHAFIEDMGAAYRRADLVVCRAGATTLAELAAAGLPAILVPYPFAADDHQRANAEVWVQAGAADMILDRELSGARLAAKIRQLAADPARRQELARSAVRLARPDAAERVVEICIAVGSGR